MTTLYSTYHDECKYYELGRVLIDMDWPELNWFTAYILTLIETENVIFKICKYYSPDLVFCSLICSLSISMNEYTVGTCSQAWLARNPLPHFGVPLDYFVQNNSKTCDILWKRRFYEKVDDSASFKYYHLKLKSTPHHEIFSPPIFSSSALISTIYNHTLPS